MKNEIQSKQKEHGQSMVELALTITILMVLLAGTIDLGRAFFTWLAMRDAAQEGASYGSINPTDNAGIESRISSNLDQIIPPGKYAVSINIIGSPCLKATTQNSIQININYQEFPLTMPFLGTILGSQTMPIDATINDTIIAPMCK